MKDTKLGQAVNTPVRYVCVECGNSYPNAGFCPKHGRDLQSNAKDLLVGSTLGAYQIAAVIGAGGMGKVYKAVNPTIGSRVAIKVLSAECAAMPELVERFFSEARAVNLIRHESIINILDLSYLPEGRPYIVMEFLDGEPLSETIATSAPLAIGSTLQFILEVLGGLEAAHKSGVCHRARKPDNIFVTPEGRAKILDFGIAKLESTDFTQKAQTVAGSLVGTPQYMSPEQAQGQAVDHRSDIYAVGVILFEALTGHLPLQGETLYELLNAHVNQAPIHPKEYRPELPDALAETVLKCLAKAPAERWQTAEHLSSALAEIGTSLPSDEWTPLVPTQRRHPSGGGEALRTPRERSREPSALETSPTYAASGSSILTLLPRPFRTKTSFVGAMVVVAGIAAAAVFGISALTKPDANEAITVATVDTPKSQTSPPESETVPTKNQQADPDPKEDIPPETEELKNPRHAEITKTEPEPVERKTKVSKASQKPVGLPTHKKPKRNSQRPIKKSLSKNAANPYAELMEDFQTGRISQTEYQRLIMEKAQETQKRALAANGVVENPRPKKWNADRELKTARRGARKLFSDARLFRYSVQGVYPSGIADLTLDRSTGVYYGFFSPKAAKTPSPHPKGVRFQPTCQVMVWANYEYIITKAQEHMECQDLKPLPMPSCSVKEIWQKAAEKGAPTENAVAEMHYARRKGKRTWTFQIDKEYNYQFEDDC